MSVFDIHFSLSIVSATGPALGGAGPNCEQFRSAQVPSQLAPRYVELGAGPTLGAIDPVGLRPALISNMIKKFINVEIELRPLLF